MVQKNIPDDPALPEELGQALADNRAARKRFAALPPSHQREYITWVATAKKPQTRRRALKAVEMLLEKNS